MTDKVIELHEQAFAATIDHLRTHIAYRIRNYDCAVCRDKAIEGSRKKMRNRSIHLKYLDCTRCRRNLYAHEFRVVKRIGYNVRHSWCRDCENAHNRKRYWQRLEELIK